VRWHQARPGLEPGLVLIRGCDSAHLMVSVLGSRGLRFPLFPQLEVPLFNIVLVSLVLSGLVPGGNVPADLPIVFPQEATVTHFTDSFGAPRAGHRHEGNDLMAPKMTEVYAAAPGTVKWVRDHGTAGRYVVIDHGHGWETWYMHLNDDTPGTDDGRAPMSSAVAVEVGDQVRAGQLIGWVGDSGNAEGSSPHTHFEIHHSGKAIDPHPFLLPAFDSALVFDRLHMPRV
jgi:murein DD-endopeptidase MepM/ murein hydrolase activator NlpD